MRGRALPVGDNGKIVVYRKDFSGFCRYAMEFPKHVCVSVNINNWETSGGKKD